MQVLSTASVAVYNEHIIFFEVEGNSEKVELKHKIKIFNDLYGNDELEVYDMLTDEVRIFFSNLKVFILTEYLLNLI